MKKIEITVVIALFIIGITFPMLATLGNSAGGRLNAEEKRKLAAFPTLNLSLKGIHQFPGDFTRYFEDNFGMRKYLLKIHSYIKGYFFGVSPTLNAIMGKQGWLFLGDDNMVADMRHFHPLTEEELKRWRDALVAKRDWLAARGIKYLFVVAPNKASIYPEYLPDYLNQVRPDSDLDQLLAYLKTNSNIQILDLRPALLAAKNKFRLYHKTDTHWNDRGGFIGYQQIIHRLSQDFPQLKPKSLSDFTLDEDMEEGQDLANMMDLRTVMHERVLKLDPKSKFCAEPADFKLTLGYPWPVFPPGHEPYARECKQGKLRAVFFQDSFGRALEPFVSEHFKRIAYIWEYPNYAEIKAAVEQEKPDVVIEERVERHIKPIIPDFSIPSDLVGKWISNHETVEIKSLSLNRIYLLNEHGAITTGLITGTKLIAKGWNITGEISSDQNRIVWSNGTSWTR